MAKHDQEFTCPPLRLHSLMLVRVSRIQVVEGEVVAAIDYPELVLLPVVIVHNQTVGVAWACNGEVSMMRAVEGG